MNVNIDAKSIGETIKNIPFKAIALFLTVISGTLILLPDFLLKKLFLLDFRDKIGPFLGIVFICSICVTLYLFMQPKIRDARIRRELSGERAKRKIENLSIDEKKIIKYMYRHQAECIVLPQGSSAIIHLKSLLMISVSSSIGQQIGNVQFFSFCLQQWVVRTMEDNPRLLQDIPERLPKDIEQYWDYMGI